MPINNNNDHVCIYDPLMNNEYIRINIIALPIKGNKVVPLHIDKKYNI